jgi:addiction module RelB/DinJ family antitoxin
MTTIPYSFRMDADTKEEFDAICRSIGLNAATAFNMFAKRVVADRSFPFVPAAPDHEARPTVTSALRDVQAQTRNYNVSEQEILDAVMESRQ